MATKRVPAGVFKATCLKLMDRIAATGEAVVVTKHGAAVVRVVPAVEGPAPFVGRLAGTATHICDIVSPIGDEWDVLSDDA
jgi:antitoxin (DNA-binding transcriptional repressor) of toxin-antitoxin stability system